MQCHAPHPLNPSPSLLAGGAHLALFTLSLEVGRLLHRSPGGAFPNFRTDNSQSEGGGEITCSAQASDDIFVERGREALAQNRLTARNPSWQTFLWQPASGVELH